MLITKDKLIKDAEEAEALLTPKPVASVVESVASSAVSSTVVSAPVSSTVPVVDELTRLKTENERLKAQLEDENNPTQKARYLTLQGMFNKVNERLKIVEKQLLERVEAPVASVVTAPEIKNVTLDKLKEDYGDGIVDVIRQLATHEANKIVSEQLKEHGVKIDNIATTVGKTKEEIFFDSLSRIVPDWKQLNGWVTEGIPQDVEFGSFLLSRIPGTKLTYDDVLNTNYSQHDVQGVAEIFNLYKKAKGILEAPVVVTEPVVSGVKPPDINNYIDPTASGSGGAPKPKEKKIYSRETIDTFYSNKTKGKLSLTEAEYDALDNEYQLAMIEGRVK